MNRKFWGKGVKCINKTLYKWYEGEYKDGKFHGQGTFYYPSGTIYKGKWKDGNKQGKGEWEGDKYEGEWMNGKWHGHGTYTFSNGGKVVGEFRGGKDWNTKEYDKDGNIIRKWVNGKGQ